MKRHLEDFKSFPDPLNHLLVGSDVFFHMNKK